MWYKDGATENDFNRDKLECQYQAELATASHSGTGISGGMAVGFRQLELIKNCLRVKGWKDVRKSRSQTSKTEKDSTDLIADSYAE